MLDISLAPLSITNESSVTKRRKFRKKKALSECRKKPEY